MKTASHIQDIRRPLAALWLWLRGSTRKGGAEREQGPVVHVAITKRARRPSPTATVLPFPLRGEALLVRLAELLRLRVNELVPQGELLLTLSHHPQLRLSIDRRAYVEFDPTGGEFVLVIEALSGARMMIQTTDFDAVVRFILQYVVEQMADDTALEAVS